jgi:hypothetical protein
MGKQRRTPVQCDKTLFNNSLQISSQDSDLCLGADETKSQPSKLLSLPLEVRHMIWKAVIGTDQILLYGRSYTTGAPMKVTKLGSITLPPTYLDRGCGDLHQHQPPKSHTKSSTKSKSTRPSKKPKIPGPLSWLRTNRQIHAEAQPILHANLRLHICDSLVFAALLSQPPESLLRPSTIRSLSFCLKLKIESDLRDGFSFCPSALSQGWETGHGACLCPWCFALGSLANNLSDQFPALRELRLRIIFRCRRGQGNTRPVIGRLANGRARKGLLYRPRNPSALVCVDGSDRIEDFVKELCGQRPLRAFQGMKWEAVDLRFCTERIEHDPGNECPHPRDWCIGRRMDEDSLQRSGIAQEIKKRLMSGGA